MIFEEALQNLRESPDIVVIRRKEWPPTTHLTLIGHTLYKMQNNVRSLGYHSLEFTDLLAKDWEVEYSDDSKETKATHSNFRSK